MMMVKIRCASLFAAVLVTLSAISWTIAPVSARVGGGGAAYQILLTADHHSSYYPIRERNARETTKEISVNELDEFMLTFSFDSPPKVLRSFFLELYMTDGFLPTSPSIHTVEQAFSNFALPELNERFVFHTVKEVNVTILAQQSIVTSSHLLGKSSRHRQTRSLQTLGSELETQVTVVFRNEPSPPVSEVEDTLEVMMKDDDAMKNFISNLTALAKGDVELAGVTDAESRFKHDVTDVKEDNDDAVAPIKVADPGEPTSTQTQERGTMIAVIVPVIAAGCLTMAVIALFVSRRKSSSHMLEQERHVASTQIGGQMVAAGGAAGVLGISSSDCTLQQEQYEQQRVNIFMADNESDDVFSFEAALAPSPNNISRLGSSNRSITRSCEEDCSDVFSGVDSELTSPRESRSVFSFLSGYKSEASTVVASNTTKAKDEDAAALATFQSSISPKAYKQVTPTSAKHSLFTFSEEEEGDLEEDDDDSEMEPLVVPLVVMESERIRSSLLASRVPQEVTSTTAATTTEPTQRSGTPINTSEETAMGGTSAAAVAAMGLTSLLNTNSSSSEDSASLTSTQEQHTTTVVVAAQKVGRANKTASPPPDTAPKQRSGFAAFFTSKKPDAVPAAAAEETATSKKKSSAWGACSDKATSSIVLSPKPGEAAALPSSAWDSSILATSDDEERIEIESVDDSSLPPTSSDDEAHPSTTVRRTSTSSTSAIPRQSISSSKAGVYLERAKIPPKEDDNDSATFYSLQGQAERNDGGNNASSWIGYESDPGPSGKSPKKVKQTLDDADDVIEFQRQPSDKVDLQWGNPLLASSNAQTARAFVGRSSTTTSDATPPTYATTPSWKKQARENAKSAALAGSNSPEFPSPAEFDSSPGGRGKGRRHAKSTTADGSTDYQAETMQQRDESLATFDAVSLSDSESADTRDETTDTSQEASPSQPLFAQEDHLVDHSMFSEDSRASSEASASRQLLSDLVWLEKKIAGVASSTASPLSEPKTKEKRQHPTTIDSCDSMSFASGDGTCTSSLHEERKKLAAAGGGGPALPTIPSTEPPTTMSSIICRDCYAPPGKLRIVIHSTKDGPAVHTVKKDSSLEGHVFPGDLIISVDNVDTRSYTAEQVMKMMTARTTYERKITVLHFEPPV